MSFHSCIFKDRGTDRETGSQTSLHNVFCKALPLDSGRTEITGTKIPVTVPLYRLRHGDRVSWGPVSWPAYLEDRWAYVMLRYTATLQYGMASGCHSHFIVIVWLLNLSAALPPSHTLPSQASLTTMWRQPVTGWAKWRCCARSLPLIRLNLLSSTCRQWWRGCWSWSGSRGRPWSGGWRGPAC